MLLNGTVDVNIGYKKTSKRGGICDWGTEYTLVVYFSAY